MKTTGEHRLHGLDGLRAISVCFVMIAHFDASQHLPSGTFGQRFIANIGRGGVDVFFVISGLLITHLILNEEKRSGRFDAGLFIKRRIVRILPPAYAYLATLALLTVVGILSVGAYDLLVAATFTRCFVMHSSWYTAHFWSLAIEEQFYLFWPLTLLVIRSQRSRLITIAVIFLVAPLYKGLYVKLLGTPPGLLSIIRTDFHYSAIVAGCFLALARHSLAVRSRYLLHPIIPILAIAALAVIWGSESSIHSLRVLMFLFRDSMIAVAICAIVNWVIESPQSLAVKSLETTPMAMIGAMSYSIYLWQQLFCSKFNEPWGIGAPDAWHRCFPTNVLLALGAAAISYLFIERPLLRVRARLRPG